MFSLGKSEAVLPASLFGKQGEANGMLDVSGFAISSLFAEVSLVMNAFNSEALQNATMLVRPTGSVYIVVWTN
jgi:hypothetical protein